MNITQSQISALYVTLFGRAGEGSGNKYWQYVASSQNITLADIANSMLNSAPAKEFFGSNLNSDENFIAHIYKTTLNKDANSDAEGKAFWLNALKSGTDRGTMVTELLKAAADPKYASSTDEATKAAHNLLVNKILASDAVADAIQNLPAGNQATALKSFQEINNAITATSTIEQIKDIIKSKSNLNLDSTKLENSLSSASKIKVISKITGKSEKQVEEALKPKEPETLKVSVAKFIEDSVKPENANNKFAIEDTTKAINDKIADIVAKADKIESIKSSDDSEAIKLTKEQFNKLTADKLSKENTIEVSELEKTDKELALNDKVDTFKLKKGNLLEVSVEEFEKLKDKAGDNSFMLKDTAANIKAKLAEIASDKNKAKIQNIDISDNNILEITKEQYKAIGDKFADDDKFKVTGLDEGDIDIAKNNKVAEFRMQEGKTLNVTIAQLEILKGKAEDGTFSVLDGAANFTSSSLQTLETNIKKIKTIKTNEQTKQEITVSKKFANAINKFAADEKLKVTEVESAEEAKEFASKPQVKSLELKGGIASLAVKAEDFKAIAEKILDNGKLDIKDTAAAIASKLDDIMNAKAKIKGIDISDTGTLSLTKAQYDSLKDKFAADDNLKITDVTGAIAASKAKDTFALKSDASGVDITNFSADDKVDFANLGVKNKGDLTTNKDSEKQMADGNIYQVDMAEDIAGKNYSDANFAELFGNGKTFKSIASGKSSTVLVKGNDASKITQIYKVEDKNNDGNIDNGEVTLVGKITGDYLEANDIITGS
ncbi:DUF4214 domain-containing protein [Campylobacter rectus]|uniref:DUF4214 domain-containing protein n=1 Tax=Campylobacter rectus TaxID=203 RepID=UPI0028DC50D7|nr:DUF4214 domain-containing protein [Campylobacter rectus]